MYMYSILLTQELARTPARARMPPKTAVGRQPNLSVMILAKGDMKNVRPAHTDPIHAADKENKKNVILLISFKLDQDMAQLVQVYTDYNDQAPLSKWIFRQLESFSDSLKTKRFIIIIIIIIIIITTVIIIISIIIVITIIIVVITIIVILVVIVISIVLIIKTTKITINVLT